MPLLTDIPLAPGSIAGDVGIGVGAGGMGTAALVSFVLIWRAGLQEHRRSLRARASARRALAAATEASLDDAWFAPEVLRGTVDETLAIAAAVWRGEATPATMRRDRALIERWAHSMIDWVQDTVQLAGRPAVDVLRVVNRAGETEVRVVLRVRLRLRRDRPDLPWLRIVRVDQRWTLGRRDGAWLVLSIGSDPLAAPVLDRPSIGAQWADEERLREQSLLELAAADAIGRGVDLGALVSPDLPAARQLLELAQVDGRFDPDLLGARIGHIVEAWEEATTGSAEPLSGLTSAEALRMLLHPAVGAEPLRLILRDAVIERWSAGRLVLSAAAPQVELSVWVSAARYVIDARTGRLIAGAIESRGEVQLRWVLTLAGPEPAGWRLTSTTDPAERL